MLRDHLKDAPKLFVIGTSCLLIIIAACSAGETISEAREAQATQHTIERLKR
jgi:hypothetical protein